MNKLDDQIRDYYQSQKLDEHRADAILETGRQLSNVRRLKNVSILALAAAAIIVVAAYFAIPDESQSVNDLASAEIAAIHHMQLDPELRRSDYQELQAAFAKLDFSIIPAKKFIRDNFILQGGRYCTLCGKTTAQLSLVNKTTGEPCFLYITKLDELLTNIQADTVVVDGIHVQMWKSDNRLFAMSRTVVAGL